MSISINEHILAKRRWFFQCVFILVLAIVLVGVGGEQQKVFAQDPDDEEIQDKKAANEESSATESSNKTAITSSTASGSTTTTTVSSEQTTEQDKKTTVSSEQTAVQDKKTAVSSEQTAVQDKKTTVSSGQTAVQDKKTTASSGQTAVQDKKTTVSSERTDEQEESQGPSGEERPPGAASVVVMTTEMTTDDGDVEVSSIEMERTGVSSPDDVITREQMSKMVELENSLPEDESHFTEFPDEDIADWAETTTSYNADGIITSIAKSRPVLENGKFKQTNESGVSSANVTDGVSKKETRRTAYDDEGNIRIVLTTDRAGNETLKQFDSDGKQTYQEVRDKNGNPISINTDFERNEEIDVQNSPSSGRTTIVVGDGGENDGDGSDEVWDSEEVNENGTRIVRRTKISSGGTNASNPEEDEDGNVVARRTDPEDEVVQEIIIERPDGTRSVSRTTRDGVTTTTHYDKDGNVIGQSGDDGQQDQRSQRESTGPLKLPTNRYRAELRAPEKDSPEYNDKLYGEGTGQIKLDTEGNIRRTLTENQNGSLTVREFAEDGGLISSHTLGAKMEDGKPSSSTNDLVVDQRDPESKAEDTFRTSKVRDPFGPNDEEGDDDDVDRSQGGDSDYNDLLIKYSWQTMIAGDGSVRVMWVSLQYEAKGGLNRQGAVIRLPGMTHRSVYDEAGNLTQVEGFSRDEDGNTTFDSTQFIKSEEDDIGDINQSEGDDADDDGSDAEAEAASIRPATPVGLNIVVLRGQEPNVTINGNPVGTEGAATHGVGLDGFLLGFLANND